VSETHHRKFLEKMMGLALLDPSYELLMPQARKSARVDAGVAAEMEAV
jgi:hypothetical protein